MSRYKCVCGHVWSDTVVPNEGYANMGDITCDQDHISYLENIGADVSSFIEALVAGKRTEWLMSYFGSADPYDDTATVVFDIQLRHQRRLFLWQCENCGRLWIQDAPESGRYLPFKPEGEGKNILAARP